MKKLLTFVGDSDPIRNYHDGSLLHIVRHYRPEEIIIIHSEHTLSKQDKITKAIEAIPGYRPRIKVSDQVVANDLVFQYSEMFNYFYHLFEDFDLQDDDELLLNISSGTPQVKSNLFLLKHMMNMKATLIQVTTPVADSNVGRTHEIDEDIETLIEMNNDQIDPMASNRCQEIEGKAFRLSLLSRKIQVMLDAYDYHAVESLLTTERNIPNRDKLLKIVAKLNHHINTQSLPSNFLKKEDQDVRKAVHYYMLIDMAMKKGDVSNVLIRLKSLAEFLLYHYIDYHYPGLIGQEENGKAYINQEQLRSSKYQLTGANLYAYMKILEIKERKSDAYQFANQMYIINEARNQIAHSLDEIDSEKIKGLSDQLKACKIFMDKQYSYDKKQLAYYLDQNRLIKDLLLDESLL